MLTRQQLLALGFTAVQIRRRVESGRLHAVMRGVYAVGRRHLAPEGWWMAAVLACGPNAVLSHLSAASLWNIRFHKQLRLEVTLPSRSGHRRPGVVIHHRLLPPADLTRHRNIPVITPIRTLIDLATTLTPAQLEAAINDADKLELVNPEELRVALYDRKGQHGVRDLRVILDRRTLSSLARSSSGASCPSLAAPAFPSHALSLPQRLVRVQRRH